MNRVLFIALVLLASCSRQAEQKKAADAAAAQAASKPPAVAVKTALAETKLVPKAIDITGSLVPDETTNISSEVQGRVAEIRYDFGQSVRKGDVIARIDGTDYQIQGDRTRAALAQALARVGLDPSQEDTTPKDTPAVRSARAQFEDAQHKYQNAKKLVESGDIATERFVEIEKLVNSRRAALEGAQDQMRTDLANVMVIRAERRLAEKRLGDTTIRAPFDGTVSAKLVSTGQFVKDNVPLLTLVKTWPLRLRLDVPEVATAFVFPGLVLSYTSEALPGKEFQATVTQVNPSLDARVRALSAEARIQSGPPSLRPGMFVQVKLVVAKGSPIVTVPKEALYNVAGLYKVFSIQGGRAKEYRINPGEAGEGWVEVPGGVLSAGTNVAVSNLANLTDNAEVTVQ